ncbi:unnamed protein product [Aureobasidium pullulans]|nr:unnamed protein product [Aureobasidium pullulans]
MLATPSLASKPSSTPVPPSPPANAEDEAEEDEGEEEEDEDEEEDCDFSGHYDFCGSVEHHSCIFRSCPYLGTPIRTDIEHTTAPFYYLGVSPATHVFNLRATTTTTTTPVFNSRGTSATSTTISTSSLQDVERLRLRFRSHDFMQRPRGRANLSLWLRSDQIVLS